MVDLDELERLEKAATPAPWIPGHKAQHRVFICAMRNALPELLAEVRKRREESGALVHLAWLMERFDVETVEELCAKLVPRPIPELAEVGEEFVAGMGVPVDDDDGPL
jgi:hypothetical protein